MSKISFVTLRRTNAARLAGAILVRVPRPRRESRYSDALCSSHELEIRGSPILLYFRTGSIIRLAVPLDEEVTVADHLGTLYFVTLYIVNVLVVQAVVG